MNNKKITCFYRIGLLISFMSIVFTAVVLWIKPLSWMPEVSTTLAYAIALCGPGLFFLVVSGLQFMDLYYRKKYEKAEDEEERAGILSANRLGSYAVIFLSVEYLAMWLCILYGILPSAMKLEDGETGDFLKSLFKMLAIMLSAMYIFLGNYIPTVRRKGQGFTSKWSDYNANTKFRSSRYAGKVFVIAGIISTLISIVFNGYIGMGTMIAALMAALVISDKKAKEYYLEEINN